MASLEARTDFLARRDIALRPMSAKGLRHTSYAPMSHRFLWYCSVPIRPPHFASFLGNFLLMGGWLGVFWSWDTLICILIWGRRDVPASVLILLSVSAGVLFGAAMAGYFACSARKQQLPSWSKLQAEVFD
jgi:hypothetical protein